MTSKPGTKEQCFEQLLLGKTVKSESWLAPIRDKAGARAQELNFPTAKQDDWRLTDLSALFQHGFHPVDSYASVTLADIECFPDPWFDTSGLCRRQLCGIAFRPGTGGPRRDGVIAG